MNLNILLISTYELGRQPFGLASPAAWLRESGAQVRCLDLSIDPLNVEAIQTADLVALHLPMHMGTRLAVPVIEQVRQINPQAHLCCFGLYAPVNATYLYSLGVDTILGGEFESDMVRLAQRLSGSGNGTGRLDLPQAVPLVSLDRQQFRVPDRSGLPDLRQYAHLSMPDGRQLVAGYTEAGRGCKYLCRHCPIVPVYGGRFRIVQREVVLADIRQQVEAGAQHITFGDPDFFNGPGHAIPLVKALHEEFPDLTYDVTIKVEHLRRHAGYLPTLKKTGCLFITTAVESFDEQILTIFDKRHTPVDFEAALRHCRQLGLLLFPTFVAFTPWTTLAGYADFLSEIARLELVEQVAPIQYTLRLLVPAGSRLLELPEFRTMVGEFDAASLSYHWRNPDPSLDRLQRDLERLVHRCTQQQLSRPETFQQIWERVHQELAGSSNVMPFLDLPLQGGTVPYLTEPWYC